MNVLVAGEGPLAEATKKACARHFGTGIPDVVWICSRVCWDFPGSDGALFLISYPVTPGELKKTESLMGSAPFAYSPENVRLAHAEEDFLNQARIICGVRKPDPRLDALFAPFTKNLLYVSIETAEMVKHALNGFLAVSATYANELGVLCKKTGADMNHVTHALRTDPRIGMAAYLEAGRPYGSHLEREINNLLSISETPLIAAAKRSNDEIKRR
jgi:UDPglucose 6-dehydrogenase